MVWRGGWQNHWIDGLVDEWIHMVVIQDGLALWRSRGPSAGYQRLPPAFAKGFGKAKPAYANPSSPRLRRTGASARQARLRCALARQADKHGWLFGLRGQVSVPPCGTRTCPRTPKTFPALASQIRQPLEGPGGGGRPGDKTAVDKPVTRNQIFFRRVYQRTLHNEVRTAEYGRVD